jgi:hypothetical protein
MARSEIDDIFATKSKGKGKASVASVSVSPVSSVSEKKQKSKKRKIEEYSSAPVDEAAPPSSKKRAPETVLNPSALASVSHSTSSSSRKVKETGSILSSYKAKTSRPAKGKDDGFADSRGTGPRKRTEEGWSVFKEDELGISAESGGMFSRLSGPEASF